MLQSTFGLNFYLTYLAKDNIIIARKEIMNICISGAQGTGKSTLLRALQDNPDTVREFIFLGNTTRSTAAAGVDINEKGSDRSQLYVLSRHLENYAIGNAIYDRGALDGLVYTAYLYEKGQVSKSTLRIAEAVFENLKYDILFYIEPEFEIEDDKVRSTNIEFRDRIVELFEEYMESYGMIPIRLKGSVEDRVKQVESTIEAYKQYLKENREAIMGGIE